MLTYIKQHPIMTLLFTVGWFVPGLNVLLGIWVVYSIVVGLVLGHMMYKKDQRRARHTDGRRRTYDGRRTVVNTYIVNELKQLS